MGAAAITPLSYPVPSQERQKQLESMGISLETSGIKVKDDKCFLVNLNADPALNELLVYYLKVLTTSKMLSGPCFVSFGLQTEEMK